MFFYTEHEKNILQQRFTHKIFHLLPFSQPSASYFFHCPGSKWYVIIDIKGILVFCIKPLSKIIHMKKGCHNCYDKKHQCHFRFHNLPPSFFMILLLFYEIKYHKTLILWPKSLPCIFLFTDRKKERQDKSIPLFAPFLFKESSTNPIVIFWGNTISFFISMQQSLFYYYFFVSLFYFDSICCVIT